MNGHRIQSKTKAFSRTLILLLFLFSLLVSLLSACGKDPSAGSSTIEQESAAENEASSPQETTAAVEETVPEEDTPDEEETTMTIQRPTDEPFKLIGYMPNWYDKSALNNVHLEKFTHINYAFAIPTEDGHVRDLPSKSFAEALITMAHENDVKVLLSVGGWSYNNEVLEPTFVAATQTMEECDFLAQNIVEAALQYGFDGVDLDWEHPNKDTYQQYENLVVCLAQHCHDNSLLFTCAVVGGSSMDKAITDTAAASFDWLNVMCYDGGEGEDHSPMSLAVDYINYWRERGIPASKLTLGVPFYERPSWNAYGTLVSADPDNAHRDTTEYQGKTVYYNGIETMQEKTRFALENACGIMIWQINQDAAKEELSLLNAICQMIQKAE